MLLTVVMTANYDAIPLFSHTLQQICWVKAMCGVPATGKNDQRVNYLALNPYIASNRPAAPMPVPMHMVTIPHFCFSRRMP